MAYRGAPAAEAPLPARALAPSRAESAFEASWALVDKGDYASAEAAFAAWLDVHGGAEAGRTGQAWFWLGHCREKLGRPDEARRAYRRVVESFPTSGAATRARQRLGELTPP